MTTHKTNFYGQQLDEEMPKNIDKLFNRIMYIENKSDGIDSAGRIGRVYFSRTKKTLYYKDKILKSLSGSGFKSNFIDIETGEEYWVSGPKKNTSDRLYGGSKGVVIDENVKKEYLAMINEMLPNK